MQCYSVGLGEWGAFDFVARETLVVDMGLNLWLESKYLLCVDMAKNEI